MNIMIDTKCFCQFYGYLGPRYIKGECHENTEIFEKDTMLKSVNFDVANGIFSAIVNGVTIRKPLKARLAKS